MSTPTLDLDTLVLDRFDHDANDGRTKVRQVFEEKTGTTLASAQASAHDLIDRMLEVTGN